MSVARVTQSRHSQGSAWIQQQKVVVENGIVTQYSVNLKVTFELEE
jgi:flavin-binding protein dodecin